MPRLLALLVLTSFLICSTGLRRDDVPPLATDKLYQRLTEGVSEIDRPGLPGRVGALLWAEPLITAPEDDSFVLVAADRPANPSIIVFGHGGYLSSDVADTAVMRGNALKILAGKDNPIVGRLGGKVPGGFKVVELQGDWTRQLDDIDVLLGEVTAIKNKQQADAIRAFLKDGHGWVTAGTGWGYEQIHGPDALQGKFPGQAILRDYGVPIASNYCQGGGPMKVKPADPLASSTLAMRFIEAADKDATIDDIKLASNSILGALPFMKPEDKAWLDKHLPAPAAAVTARNPRVRELGRVALRFDLDANADAPPAEVTTHPLAGNFPGTSDAAPTEASATVDFTDLQPRERFSTGLYAPPGQAVTISHDPELAGAFDILVGAHSDTVFHKPKWDRAPRITRTFPMSDAGETVVANSFGGPIYLVAKRDVDLAAFDGKTTNLEADAVWAMPMYHWTAGADHTSADSDWNESARHAPAPWAELRCDDLIITVPSEAVRKLESPSKVMAHWQAAMDASAALSPVRPNELMPMRIVNDMQISAGYMHAGYPIMTHLDVAENQFDLNWLRSDCWGFYHEIGHNFQRPAWTWSGLGEVTCNLFTMYVLEEVCDQSAEKAADRALGKNQAKIDEHLAKVARGEASSWTSGPFLALAFYAQLRMEFGWQPIIDTFADLNAEPAEKGEQARIDKFFEAMCRHTDRDLSPYFAKWGIAVSDTSAAKFGDLEPWSGPSE